MELVELGDSRIGSGWGWSQWQSLPLYPMLPPWTESLTWASLILRSLNSGRGSDETDWGRQGLTQVRWANAPLPHVDSGNCLSAHKIQQHPFWHHWSSGHRGIIGSCCPSLQCKIYYTGCVFLSADLAQLGSADLTQPVLSLTWTNLTPLEVEELRSP